MNLKNWFLSLTKKVKPSTVLNAVVNKSQEKLGAGGLVSDYTAKVSTAEITRILETLPIDPRIEIEHDLFKERYVSKEKKTGRHLRYIDEYQVRHSHSRRELMEFLHNSLEELHKLPPMGPPTLTYPPKLKTPTVAKGFILPTPDGDSIVLPSGKTDWAFIHLTSDGSYMVRTPLKSVKTDNFFDAMIEVASFYGVSVDEDSSSKE